MLCEGGCRFALPDCHGCPFAPTTWDCCVGLSWVPFCAHNGEVWSAGVAEMCVRSGIAGSWGWDAGSRDPARAARSFAGDFAVRLWDNGT